MDLSGSLSAIIFRENDGAKERFGHKYEIVEKLGQGAMGEIFLAKIKEDAIGGSAYRPKKKKKDIKSKVAKIFRREKKRRSVSKLERRNVEVFYAVKVIRTDRIETKYLRELENEISIVKTLDHPHIVKAHESFSISQDEIESHEILLPSIHLVMECCYGGDLYSRSPYSEKGAARIAQNLLSAVLYMHKHKIVHRDLKFENILFEDESDEADIKVVDFGLSAKFIPSCGEIMTRAVGTIYTMAPEVFNRTYTAQVDLWSTGVIIYMLLSQNMPFFNRKRTKMIEQIMNADYTLESEVWDEISDNAKYLIRNLLVVDPTARYDAEKALEHEWFKNRSKLSNSKEKIELEIKGEIGKCFYRYKDTSTLKKVALNVVAHNSSNAEIFALRRIFAKCNTSKNGVICFNEFKQALAHLNYSQEELSEMFECVNVNGTSEIMYTEFLAATVEARGKIEEERIAEAFDRIDIDGSGYIQKSELKSMLGKNATRKTIDDIMKQVDTNGDGKISYDEFLNHFRAQTIRLSKQILKDELENISEEETERDDDCLLGPLDDDFVLDNSYREDSLLFGSL